MAFLSNLEIIILCSRSFEKVCTDYGILLKVLAFSLQFLVYMRFQPMEARNAKILDLVFNFL